MRFTPLAMVVLVLVLAAAAVAEEAPVVLCDFDRGEPTDGWTLRNIAVAEIATPQGRGLRLSVAQGRGTISRSLDQRDWRRFRALSLQARVEAKAPISLRILAFQGRGRAALLRRFELEPGDWREVVLPLAEWREDTVDKVCDFSHLERIVLRWDAGEGAVSLDTLQLLPGDRGEESCMPTTEDRLVLAFPGGNGKAYDSKHYLLLTDATALRAADARKLLRRLEQAFDMLRKRYRLPGTPALPGKAPLVVFEKKEEFQAFFTRLGDHYGLSITPPSGGGYSCLGVAASFVVPRYGWDRPTFVHEATHATVRRKLAIPSGAGWIQEALANAVQLRLYPDSAKSVPFQKHFRDRLEGGGFFLPLSRLVALERVSGKHYVQLLTVMEYLAERRRKDLPRFWKRIAEREGSLREEALAALTDDLPAFEQAYLAWGAKRKWR